MDQQQQISPSPAPSGDMLLPPGFNALVQHNNAVTSYPREQAALDAMELHSQHSQPPSRYGTPVPHSHPQPLYNTPMYPSGGYEQHFPGYQPGFSPEASQYPLPDEMHQVRSYAYSTPATSPPASLTSDLMTTRNGTVLHKSSMPKTSGVKSGRVEKKSAKAKARPVKEMTTLYCALSRDEKNADVPVVDIEAYVNRTAEERQREVETGKSPGRVKRPMNAFMLYRKAFQDRAKKWCAQNNHQIVSRVCGASWPMESEELRAQYTEWAKIERDNHQKAHPGYKFTPAKPRKEKKKAGEGDDGYSDFGDYEWRPSGKASARGKTPSQDSDAGWLPSGTRRHVQQHDPNPHPPMPSLPYGAPGGGSGYMSHFQFTNPGKPMPGQYGSDYAMASHYWQQSNHRDPRRQLLHGTVEDVVLRRTQTPSPNLEFHGLPGKYTALDLGPYGHQLQQPLVQAQLPHQTPPPPAPVQQSPQTQQQHSLLPQQFEPTKIDPSLIETSGLPSSGIPQHEQDHWGIDHGLPEWHTSGGGGDELHHQQAAMVAPFPGFEHADQEHDPQVQMLKGDEGSWQIQDTDWVEASVET